MILPKIILVFAILLGFTSLSQAENTNIDIESFSTTEDIENNDRDSDFLPIIKNNSASFENIELNNSAELKNYRQGKIIALNKITATSRELIFKVGEEQYFGNIKIKLHKCLKNLDPYKEDNYLLLTITEYKIDEDPILLFQGWMTSASISLSTFEHPIYEIFAKNCL
ncbi:MULTISPECIES: DUF2155 domain-containing protein [unclassified Rickettsia]|uniref:DUF2155 domain-containing protein n=1 Tax=unclassified Rickettsia TaxID=114295 RepID=UPI00209CAB15|nr:DUF2155 domain-containing protein [Rickettsia endosymbiont of Ceutorhynchus assimilis]